MKAYRTISLFLLLLLTLGMSAGAANRQAPLRTPKSAAHTSRLFPKPGSIILTKGYMHPQAR